VKEKKIILHNLKINYKEKGEGPSLLILHGWGGSSDSWKKVQEFIGKRGYKVIVPDLPGFGKSDTPPRPWGIEDYVKFVKDFTEKVGIDKFILVGHSFGGSLASKFSAQNPQKVKDLVLCAPAGIKPRPGLKEKAIFFVSRIGRKIFRQKFLVKSKAQAENFFYAMIRYKDYSKANETMKKTMQRVLEYYEFPDEEGEFYQDLSKIQAKTLIVWGREDKILPVNFSRIFRERIKNSKRIILSEVGHSPNLKSPERLSKILLSFFRS